MKKPGIYLITNIINWKRYVGKDSDLPGRWNDHKSALRTGIHYNTHLQRAWDMYGEGAFVYSIIRYCKKEDLVEWEQFYMDLYDCVNNKNADGSEVSVETCAKISAALTGKKLSTKHKAKLSVAHTGKKYTEKHKANMSAAQKGKQKPPLTDKHKAKLSTINKGKILTEEHKTKIGITRSRVWEVVSPVGEVMVIKNLSQFCKDNSLTQSGMWAVVAGEQTHHKGWKVRKL